MSTQPTDVIVVGAGFGGLYTIYLLRERGFNVKGFEEAPEIGGCWYWNAYPGARVDSDVPIYEYSKEELWKDWNWTEKFPGRQELRKYFEYVDGKLDVKRHIQFNSRVVDAEFDPSTDRWAVRTQDGNITYSRFMVFCTGFAAKPYIPSIKGLENFKGIWHHTARWPQEGVELKGKRVAVIGTGASGVQVIQECATEVAKLTVFQRTPNLALPMRQRKITEEFQSEQKSTYPEKYRRIKTTFAGFLYHTIPKNGADVSTEERTAAFEELWDEGGFRPWLGNYVDLFTSRITNEHFYDFWRDKVRQRISDPVKQELLAPTKPPHPFGTKRPCLEQEYFEMYNRSNVELVSLKENPIVEITEKAVRTSDGVEHEVDIIVVATGFDAVTGSLARINIKGTDCRSIEEKWAPGLKTYMGMTTANYPNMFFLYGPHGPTAFCNGPTCCEIQSEWIVNCITYLRDNNITRIEPSREAEEEWSNNVDKIFSGQLFSEAKSWYTGANIPGKKVQSLNFTGGLPAYVERISTVAKKGYEGFILSGKRTEFTA
ncbi:hypothetical protein M422DRAFT_235129 [Sphaerobolus stellatus SS14]|uniref:Uncharacterized protein n=1 Tax=Sphaerobolus stellatus (strain SS14) TaxID=990650 RepID=A0A0C9UWV4_SPHS4|nr:hypothetical protein M422DRAFT_235129 [Sphaerobolus stellatus SS14]